MPVLSSSVFFTLINFAAFLWSQPVKYGFIGNHEKNHIGERPQQRCNSSSCSTTLPLLYTAPGWMVDNGGHSLMTSGYLLRMTQRATRKKLIEHYKSSQTASYRRSPKYFVLLHSKPLSRYEIQR